MENKEDFSMYAININEPYIVQEKDVEKFLKDSKKQVGISEKLSLIFSKECFEFKKNENGLMVASIDVNENDVNIIFHLMSDLNDNEDLALLTIIKGMISYNALNEQ